MAIGKKILSTDDWRDIFDDHNDSVDAYDGIIGSTSLPTTAQTLTGAIAEQNQAIATLNVHITQGNFGTKYLNDTSKTATTLLSNDFANLAQRDIQFYCVRPSDDNLYGWMIKVNDTYGYGMFSGPNEGSIIHISNNNGTWRKHTFLNQHSTTGTVSNANQFDSSNLQSGALTSSKKIIDAYISDVNEIIVLHYVYNGRYFFRFLTPSMQVTTISGTLNVIYAD